MSISGFPDLAAARAITRTVSELKERINVVQQESVTGLTADIAENRKGDVGSVMTMRKAIEDAQNYGDAVTLGLSRAGVSQSALALLEDNLSGFAAQVTTIAEGTAQPDTGVLAAEAASRLETLVGTLNVRHGGRTLFSGTATDGAAVAPSEDILSQVGAILASSATAADADAALTLFFDDPSGGFYGGVYLGDDGQAGVAQTGPNSTVTYGKRADDPAIRDLIRGLAVLATHDQAGFAGDGDETRELLASVTGSLFDADDGVTRMRGELGAAEARLEEAKTYLEANETTFTLALNNTIGRDQFEAATEFQNLTNQLEASYAAAARVGSLTILNFL